MKKLIVVIFALGLAFNMQAQKVDLGLKLGANFSNVSDAGGLNFKNKTGLVAGAFLSIGTSKFAVQPEVLYSQQGAKTDFGSFDLDYVMRSEECRVVIVCLLCCMENVII